MSDLLVLHAARLRGMSTTAGIADRFDLPLADVEETVLDQQAFGRLAWHEFGASAGWALTERGKAHGEQLLAEELGASRSLVEAVYERFLPLNSRLREAVTRWQTRPIDGDPYAPNDHRDLPWDSATLAEIATLGRDLSPLIAEVAAVLPRFAGYDSRYGRAALRARSGDRAWVDGVGIDSCHTVWFELHEDFLATLGLTR